jgi:hypothetical protein
VSMVTGWMSVNFYGYDSRVRKLLEDRRVFGYGLLLVARLSSYREIARGAREFIRWTVKTFDRRG